MGIGTSTPSARLSIQNLVGYDLLFAGTYGSDIHSPNSSLYISAGTSTSSQSLGLSGYSHVSLSTAVTERVRINSSGNVGIGTSSPATRLHIGTGGVIRVAGMVATGNKVVLANPSGDLSALAVGTTAQFLRGDGTWQTPATGTNYWTLNASNHIYNNNAGGRVGIGTSAPAVKLDVAGSVAVNTPLWYRSGAPSSENLNVGIRVASTATTLAHKYPILGTVRATSTVGGTWYGRSGVAGMAYNLDGTRLLTYGALGVARATNTSTRDYFGVLGALDADDVTTIGALSQSAAVHGTVIDYNSETTPNIYSAWFYGAPVKISDLGLSGDVSVYADNNGVLQKGASKVTVKSGFHYFTYKQDANDDTIFNISFGHTFASPPNVVLTLRRVAGNTCEAFAFVQSVSTTDATVVYSGTQNNPTCYDIVSHDGMFWVAVGN